MADRKLAYSSMAASFIYLLSLLHAVTAARIDVQSRGVFVPQRVNIPLQFSASGLYMMPVDMSTGSAAQNFNFTLSMGTGLTYVAGNSCQSCSGVSLYNQAASSTARSLSGTDNTTFLGGTSASGPLIKETCGLKTSNGSSWSYPNQTVVVVNQQANQQTSNTINNLFGTSSGVSGLVGLGTNRVPSNSSSNGYNPNFQDSIYGQWLGYHPTAENFTFGMALDPPLDPADSSVSQAAAGILHWLQPDTSAYDPSSVTWKGVDNSANGSSAANYDDSSSTAPSTTESQDWTVSLDGWVFISGDNHLANTKSVLASVEPMYTNLYLPLDQATLIHAAIHGSSIQSKFATLGSQSQAWSIPCDASFSFGIVAGSQTFSLDRNSLIIKQSDGTCSSALEGWTNASETEYLLGSRFISSVYLIFTIGRDGSQSVGFAPRANDPTKSKTNIGAIVGGTIGGVAFLLIVAFIIFFFFYQRRHRTQTERASRAQFDPDLNDEEPKPVEPYTVGVPQSITTTTTAVQGVGTTQPPIPISPNSQSHFNFHHHSYSSAATDPLLSDINLSPQVDVLPPAYEASEGSYGAQRSSNVGSGGSGTGGNRYAGEKAGHVRNPSDSVAGNGGSDVAGSAPNSPNKSDF